MRYSLFNAGAGNRKGRGFWITCGENLLSAIVFCVGLVILAKLTLSDLDWADIICSENGPVERMSAALWFMVVSWCIVAAWKLSSYRVEWLALGTLFLLFGLRELDIQRWLTSWNLEKLKNYWSPQIPAWERLFVIGLLVIPAMVVGGVLIYRVLVQMRLATTWRAPWMRQMLVGGLLLVFCLLLDKSTHGLVFLGFKFLEGKELWIMGVEEFGEFVLAAYTVSALWPHWMNVLSEDDCTSS